MEMLIAALVFFAVLFAASAFLLVRSIRKTSATLKKMFQDEEEEPENAYLEEWQAQQPAHETNAENKPAVNGGSQEE